MWSVPADQEEALIVCWTWGERAQGWGPPLTRKPSKQVWPHPLQCGEHGIQKLKWDILHVPKFLACPEQASGSGTASVHEWAHRREDCRGVALPGCATAGPLSLELRFGRDHRRGPVISSCTRAWLGLVATGPGSREWTSANSEHTHTHSTLQDKGGVDASNLWLLYMQLKFLTIPAGYGHR